MRTGWLSGIRFLTDYQLEAIGRVILPADTIQWIIRFFFDKNLYMSVWQSIMKQWNCSGIFLGNSQVAHGTYRPAGYTSGRIIQIKYFYWWLVSLQNKNKSTSSMYPWPAYVHRWLPPGRRSGPMPFRCLLWSVQRHDGTGGGASSFSHRTEN